MSDKNNNFFSRLQSLLDKSNMTYSDLSKELEINKSTISMWKTGKVTPSTKMILKIAEYFNVSATYLMYGEEIEKKWTELMDTKEKIKNSSSETLKEFLAIIKNIIISNDKADIFTHIPEEDLLYYFWNLNEEGQQKTIEYAGDLTENPKYRKDTE